MLTKRHIKLNITEDLKDELFKQGMRNGSQSLGDIGTQQDGGFVPEWDDAFLKGDIHGVTLVTGDSRDTVEKRLEEVKKIFSGSVDEVATVSGDARPDEERGNEQ